MALAGNNHAGHLVGRFQIDRLRRAARTLRSNARAFDDVREIDEPLARRIPVRYEDWFRYYFTYRNKDRVPEIRIKDDKAELENLEPPPQLTYEQFFDKSPTKSERRRHRREVEGEDVESVAWTDAVNTTPSERRQRFSDLDFVNRFNEDHATGEDRRRYKNAVLNIRHLRRNPFFLRQAADIQSDATMSDDGGRASAEAKLKERRREEDKRRRERNAELTRAEQERMRGVIQDEVRNARAAGDVEMRDVVGIKRFGEGGGGGGPSRPPRDDDVQMRETTGAGDVQRGREESGKKGKKKGGGGPSRPAAQDDDVQMRETTGAGDVQRGREESGKKGKKKGGGPAFPAAEVEMLDPSADAPGEVDLRNVRPIPPLSSQEEMELEDSADQRQQQQQQQFPFRFTSEPNNNTQARSTPVSADVNQTVLNPRTQKRCQRDRNRRPIPSSSESAALEIGSKRRRIHPGLLRGGVNNVERRGSFLGPVEKSKDRRVFPDTTRS
jgi:hypothetical protein